VCSNVIMEAFFPKAETPVISWGVNVTKKGLERI